MLTSSNINSSEAFIPKANEEPILPDYSLFNNNTTDLSNEMNWLGQIIFRRMNDLAETGISEASLLEIMPLPELTEGAYGIFMKRYNLKYPERLTTILNYASKYRPDMTDMLLINNPKTNARFKITGGVVDQETGHFFPTLKTALFLLGGTDDRKHAYYHSILHRKNRIFADGVVVLSGKEGETFRPDFKMKMDMMYFNHFLYSDQLRLDATENFPARLMTTKASFEDVILPQKAKDSLQKVIHYAQNHKSIGEETGGEYQGCIVLFYGPPGTGKSMTASLLGKHLGIDTYKVEPSQIISKYVGETEKNINRLFDRFDNRDAIIFFDEADAIFGKRSEVKDTQDQYNNQEISNLLQRIDECKNIVILATNFRNNMDFAFKRRTLIEVHISPPDQEERRIIWEKAIKKPYHYADETIPVRLSRYAMTGANINNVLKLATSEAKAKGTMAFTLEMIDPLIRYELITKEGRGVGEIEMFPTGMLSN